MILPLTKHIILMTVQTRGILLVHMILPITKHIILMTVQTRGILLVHYILHDSTTN